MKLSDDMRFPHPILSQATGDFGAGDFEVALTVEERPADGQLRIECDTKVTDPDVELCITNGHAALGLFVTCAETYFNQLCQVPLGKGAVSFEGGLLRGRVVLRPLIWLVKPLEGWKPAAVHSEFGSHDFNIDKAKLLGLGQEFVINVGHEKLAPLESIFNLAKKSDLPDGEVLLDLEGPRIKILVNEKTFEGVSHYRNSQQGRAVLLNGIYLPAVMEVLRSLSSAGQTYESYRWYQPFIAKCDHHQIKLEANEPLQQAQVLLSQPLSRLLDEQERLLP